MRGPTLNEARRADREIMDEVLKWVSKGKGSVMAGLAHYANNTDEPLWKLLSPQPQRYAGSRAGGWRSIIPAIRRELPLSPGGRKGKWRKIPLQRRERSWPSYVHCVQEEARATMRHSAWISPGRKKRRKRKATAQAKKGSGKDKAPK